MNMKTCTHDKCTKEQISRGLCDTHYKMGRRKGTLTPIRVYEKIDPATTAGRNCSACGNYYTWDNFYRLTRDPLKYEAKCKQCRKERRQGYAPDKTPEQREKMRKVCEFEGCDRTLVSRGLCKTHYVNLMAGKELKPLRPYVFFDESAGGRECTKCHEFKPWDQYHRVNSRSDMRTAVCKPCHNIKVKTNRRKKKEKD